MSRHNLRQPTYTSSSQNSQTSWLDKTLSLPERREEFRSEDQKYEDLREELDQLVQWAASLSMQRNTLMLAMDPSGAKSGRHQQAGPSGSNRSVFKGERFQRYKSLVWEQRNVEDAIQRVSQEYSLQRAARKSAHARLVDQRASDRGHETDTIHQADAMFWAKTRLEVHKTRMSTLAGIGVLGVGIAWTTVFGATRGSLGVFSWSWAWSNATVCLVAMFQLLVPDQYQLAHNRRGLLRRLRFFEVSAGLFMFVAMVLLAYSIMDIRFWIKVTPSGNQPYFAGAFTLVFMAIPPLFLVALTIFRFVAEYTISGMVRLWRS